MLELSKRERAAIAPQLTATAQADASIWEVEALDDFSNDRGALRRAMECLLGIPNFDRPNVTIHDGRATVVTTASADSRGCIGPIRSKLTRTRFHMELLERGAGPCRASEGPLVSPEQRVVLEVQTGRRTASFSPSPTEHNAGRATWIRPPHGAQLDVRVDVKIDALTYVATQIDTSAVVKTRVPKATLGLRVQSALGWLPELLMIVALIAASRTIQVVRSASIALLVVGAVAVDLSPKDWDPDAASVVAVAALLAVAALASPSRWRVRGPAVAIAIAAMAALYGRRSFERQHVVLALAALLPPLVVVISGLAARIRDVTPMVKTDVVPWPFIRGVVTVGVASSAAYAVGRTIGEAIGEEDHSFFIEPSSLAYAAAAFATVAVVCAAASAARHPGATMSNRAALVGTLVWASLALRRPMVVASIALPLALIIGAMTLLAFIRAAGEQAPAAGPAPGTLRHLLARLKSNISTVAAGPTASWVGNARTAVEVGAVLALLPVGYFVLAALTDLPARASFGPSFAFLIAGAMHEAGRWLATAWLFGAAYTRLPGRTGPEKAAAMVFAWFVGAGTVEVLNRWVSEGSSREWAFPGLQLILFLLVLAVLFDRLTLATQNKSWKDLQDVYGIHRLRGAFAYLAPAVLAVLGIAEQVQNGSGAGFVQNMLSGVGSL